MSWSLLMISLSFHERLELATAGAWDGPGCGCKKMLSAMLFAGGVGAQPLLSVRDTPDPTEFPRSIVVAAEDDGRCSVSLSPYMDDERIESVVVVTETFRATAAPGVEDVADAERPSESDVNALSNLVATEAETSTNSLDLGRASVGSARVPAATVGGAPQTLAQESQDEGTAEAEERMYTRQESHTCRRARRANAAEVHHSRCTLILAPSAPTAPWCHFRLRNR